MFADEELSGEAFTRASALWNESYSFQVGYRNKGGLCKGISIEVDSSLEDFITVKSIGLVPAELPVYHNHDEHILRGIPGLYPDPLYPVDPEGLVAFPHQWRSVWVTVDLHEQVQPGTHEIAIKFLDENGHMHGEEMFQLEVIPVSLPEQELIHTEWFHADCLAIEYDVEVFSDKHWELIEKYVKTAAEHGVNMIYTPLFTPPLDTEVGGERPTVQLIDVEKTGDLYTFGFTRLLQWIEMCQRQQMKYFEFSHLFTQWGAKHAPKIIATENGEMKQVFGWETDAAGKEYTAFLDQFLPQLVAFIKEQGLEDYSYFHVSDEPTLDHLESYQKASAMIQEHLAEFPIMDALSDYDFYEKGYVKNPIPANDHMEPFIENEVEDLWTYYCCVQYKEVSNRFFAFPSARNRILAYQLFKYDIKGFLHWGYNFWFTQYSKKVINPYEVTDAGHAFASGDAYLVYPGEDGPVESIRLKVFYEGLQDLRALQLLTNKMSKEELMTLLENNVDEPITFHKYPRESEWLLQKRAAINALIKEHFLT